MSSIRNESRSWNGPKSEETHQALYPNGPQNQSAALKFNLQLSVKEGGKLPVLKCLGVSSQISAHPFNRVLDQLNNL